MPSKLTDKTNFNLDLFFEFSADLFCIAGYDGYFKRINPAVSKVLGYTNDELFARPINDFIHPEDQEITQRNRDNLKNTIPLLNFENRYITKTGDVVWLAWTSMPDDNEKAVYAIAKNITHKKKQEQNRNELLTKLTEINNDLKQLNYTTSHDLRAPVNNLLSVFNLLDLDKIQDTEFLNFIEMFKTATESLKQSLSTYIDNLTQRDSLHIHVEQVNLNECIHTIKQSLKALIHNSNTTINIDFSEIGYVKFNKAYLESTFLNLITNSIKYARPEQPPVISVYSKLVDNTTQVIFLDNGLGFDMDKVKDKVFGFRQRFHDHADGKGIGLYLVYNHITNLGGTITIESKPNEGAKFIITFLN
ncbi:MAG: PAS domain-containing sensor histidine kinase [Mucilaginibacter sp.]